MRSSVSSQNNKSNLPIQFFDYWDDLQNFLQMDEERAKLLDQEIRGSIVDILALGIQDIDPRNNQPRKRHAMTAKELNELINQRLDEPVKKSNLYFHLDKLEDNGLIKEVGQIRIGKQHITYYGRTAKAFTMPNENKKEKFGELITNDQVKELILRINPSVPENDIAESIDAAFDNYFRKCRDEVIAEWLEKYQADVLELEIDVRKFFDIFDIIAKYDEKTIEAMRRFAKLLDFQNYR